MEGPGKNKKNKIKNRKYCRVFRTWLANTSKTRLTASAGRLPDRASGAWPGPNTRETRLTASAGPLQLQSLASGQTQILEKQDYSLSQGCLFYYFHFPGARKKKKKKKKKKRK